MFQNREMFACSCKAFRRVVEFCLKLKTTRR
jgi:hypothetical protein